MSAAALWWWGAAVITFIYFCLAIFALYLVWEKWIKRKPQIPVAVIRLVEDDEESGIFEDASSEPNAYGFDNPGFEV
nr:vpu protein [Simian-Human immunodeficiency virus]AVK70436.1 vpu protein [Simian-Human immunodeficiency virus]AVK70441.1 vpu protein [Simian-Human immunodeficiency virus]AVK70445.1 vpu protein [Simian-Human immunodeficiency virus]AVK70450.1 vpu protein [Simian-Human immunodeficiency virus]